MNDQELDRLFERFRRRGDVLALGAIFDATAPELLRVAMSLVREPGEADDLLQETFLTAIERSERYEAGRRLVPWLFGILVLHAKERRAQRRRELDPARLALREAPVPEAQALGRELEQELERALAELSARERVVLEAYLRQGKGAAEIAGETGTAPGAVRMQIHRGLDRLRRLLPAGLALGAAGSANAQGTSAVRARVLRAGETATKNLAPGTGSALGAGMAGALMSKKLVLAGVLAAVAGVWFLVERVARAPVGDPVQVARAESPARPREESTLTRRSGEEGTKASAVESSSGGPSRAPLAAAADPDLAALRGRVVEHDGRPVSGMPVALIEVEESQIYPTLFASVDAPALPRIVAARTVTGADGTFVLRGATTRALQGLGVDLGGQRATLRMLDALLSPGDTTELGDVVLAPAAAIAGRVVDERGQPVPGARVRAGAIPEIALGLGLQHLAPGGALSELPKKDDHPYYVFELPDWTAELEPMLPLATTSTDTEGRFALDAPAGRLTVLVDAPGLARLSRAALVAADVQQDLGELVLEGGASARGRVLDEHGRPVPSAEIRAGTVGEMFMAVFGPIRSCDAEGRFAVEHLPSEFKRAVIARRDSLSPWVCARETGGEFVVTLGAERELVAEVVDPHGNAVSEPEFFVRAGRDVPELGVLAPPFRPLAARKIEGESMAYRLGPLAYGTYVIAARAAGRAGWAETVELGAEDPPMLFLRLAPLCRREVLVRDGATGASVAGALVCARASRLLPVSSARTDAGGRAWLELGDDSEREFWLTAEHPNYAPAGRALVDTGEDPVGPIVVELTQGARLVARIADRVLADQHCALQLWYEGGTSKHEFTLPRFCAVPSEGALELGHLEPGRWSWNLFESVAGSDVLAFLSPDRVPQSLANGDLVLAEGQTFELALSGKRPRGTPGPGATLSGIVHVDGRLAGELDVSLSSLEDPDEVLSTKGYGGRFRFDGVPVGHYFVSVSAPVLSDEGKSRELARETIELTGTEERELVIDVASLPVDLRVLTADGEPAKDVELRLVLMDENYGANVQTTTDQSGRVKPVLPRAGRYAVFAIQREEGAARAELEVSPDGANELELRLSRGVDCAGRLHLEPGARFEAGSGELIVSPEDDSWFNARVSVELVDGTAPFRLVGLSPGKYKVLLWGGDDMLNATFELPEWGEGNLELRFTACRGRR